MSNDRLLENRVEYKWEWKTGKLTKTETYHRIHPDGGSEGGCESTVLICLWGFMSLIYNR